MAGGIYSKPILFAVVATAVILVGTIVTMFYPMFTPGMHPKLDGLKPYTALELAGKDVYMQEGCNNCHSQTVRPLRTEVMRYGEYSKAGEFAYDRPFLWGSKRTGPDLARIGGKYPDAWHYKHFENAQAFVHPKSNMPAYGWLAGRQLKPASIKKRMEVNGFPYTEGEISGLAEKSELDALVAYMQAIGTAVKKGAPPAPVVVPEGGNPYAGRAEVVHEGEELYEAHCQMCHGYEGSGDIGPEIVDFGGEDADLYEIIARGVEGEMPAYASVLKGEEIWYIVTYLGSLSAEALEPASPSVPDAVNPLAGDPVAIEEGAEVYAARCAVCHGKELEGGIGPSFLDEGIVADDNELYYTVITKGREGGMPNFGAQLSQKQVWQVISYLRAMQEAR